MTREDAIDLLDNLIGMVDDNHDNDYDTALKMGIQALEYDDAKYHEEHGEVVVDRAVWEDAKRALEQEPCDVFDEYGNYKYPSDVELTEPNTATSMPSGDAVSRQAVHEAIEKWAGSMSVLIALPTREIRPLLDSIHKLPSVKPQPNTGHWIYKPKTDLYICDKCGSYCPQDKFGRIETDFCPKCGARMVEPQESEVRNDP